MTILAKANRALLAAALVSLPAAVSSQTDKAVGKQADKVAAEANKLTSDTAKLNNVVANDTQATQNSGGTSAGDGNGTADNRHHRDHDHGKWGLLGLLGLAGLLGFRRRDDHDRRLGTERRDYDDRPVPGTTPRTSGTDADTRL